MNLVKVTGANVCCHRQVLNLRLEDSRVLLDLRPLHILEWEVRQEVSYLNIMHQHQVILPVDKMILQVTQC